MVNRRLPTAGPRVRPRQKSAGEGRSGVRSNFTQKCAAFASKLGKKLIPQRTVLSSLSAKSQIKYAEKDAGIEAKGRAMMFLLRVAFWLSIVIILLPSGSQPGAGSQINTADAVSAAGAAVADMRQFCSRQPEACAVGAQAATSFGQKAQAGAKMLYEFLSEALAPVETGSITTASVGKIPPAGASQNTLRPADLLPAWRGPMPRPDPRRNHTS